MNHLCQCRVMWSSPFAIRNLQPTFIWYLSLLSFVCLNIAVSGELAAKELYTEIMERGRARLQASYEKALCAEKKGDKATAVCSAKDRASEIELKQLNAAKKKLTEEARALAEEALKEFRSAEALDPRNPEPIFWEGLALLQLKEYCSAINKIQSAREGHYRNPKEPAEITFALGAALVGSSNVGSAKFEEGKKLLADYIKQAEASPNRKEAFPNYCKAKIISDAAVGQAATLQKKNQEKNKEPNHAACPMPISEKTELPFTVFVLSAIGYNDNVLTLGRGQSLPPGTPHKGSLYNESSFGMGRDFSFSHASSLSQTTGWLSDKLSLKYVFIADTFEDLPERDRLLHTLSGSYQRSFTPNIGGLLKVSDQWLYINQSPASNILSAQEALVLDLNTKSKTLLSYYLVRTDGLTPVTWPNNPDGFTHRAELTQIWVVIQDKHDFSSVLTLTGQYAHEWDQPSGIAGQFQRDELLGKIECKVFHARDQCSFVQAVTTSASELWQADWYTHATFISLTSNSPFARSDDTNQVVFAMSVSMWYDQYMKNAGVPDASRLEAIFQYRYTTRDSNVQSKAYDQNLFFASLKLNF